MLLIKVRTYLVGWNRIRFLRGAKMARNLKKWRNFMFWSAGCSLSRAACPVAWTYYGGLEINELQFLTKTIVKFLQSLVIKTLDPDLDIDPNPHWPKILVLDPYCSQCESTTLTKTIAKVSRTEKNNQIIICVHLLTEAGKGGGRFSGGGCLLCTVSVHLWE